MTLKFIDKNSAVMSQIYINNGINIGVNIHTRKKLLGPWKFLLRCNLYHHRDAKSRIRSSLKRGNCILSSFTSLPSFAVIYYSPLSLHACMTTCLDTRTHDADGRFEWNIIDFYSQLFCPICPVHHNLITITLVIRTVT